MNLLEHSSDCLPLLPCPACEIVAWLRGKMSAEDFAELVTRARTLAPPKRIRRRRASSPAAPTQQVAA